MGFWPLDEKFLANDISGNGNNGSLSNVALAAGPGDQTNTAIKFLGLQNSFIEIPNNGALETKYSLTLAFYIRCEKSAYGPIFAYNGVHIWKTDSGKIYARFSEHDMIYIPVIQRESWEFVAVICSFESGIGKIYHKGQYRKQVLFRMKPFNSHVRKTSGPIRIGAQSNENNYFKGRLSCLQLYDRELTLDDLERARAACDCSGSVVFVYL